MKTFKEFIVEAENLLELSPMTKQIYLRKAATAKQAHLQKAKEHENAADVFSFTDTTGFKRTAASERYKALKRQRGIDRVKSRMKEEVEQIDELKKSTLGSYIRRASGDVAIQSSAATQLGRQGDYEGENKSLNRVSKRFRGINAATKKLAKEPKNEEVEQIDELSKKTLGSYVKKAVDSVAKNSSTKGISRAKSNFYGAGTPGDPYGANWRDSHDNRADSLQDKVWKRKGKISQAVDKLTKEEMEQIDEVITKSTPTGKVISDFVHSKNPKFAGKSKRERIRMALGAKYAMMKNEDVDLQELKQSTMTSYLQKRHGMKTFSYFKPKNKVSAKSEKGKTNALASIEKKREAEREMSRKATEKAGMGAAQDYKQGRYSGD